MSINSLQNRMEQRAASMAQMAQHASNPNEIMSIQQRLVSEVQNGTIKPYVGIPLIQELTKQLEKVKAQAAMGAMGAPVQGQGMAPTPPQVPVAQQVMEQAIQSQGVEALPSNLPQDYAGGGIIAFEDGGPVQHLDGGGSPISRWWEDYTKKSNEVRQAENLRNKLQMKYGQASDVIGLFQNQTDAERQTAKDITGRLGSLTLPQMQALYDQGPSALPPVTSAPSAAPPATPAAPPVASAPSAAPPATPAASPASTFGGINFKLPTLPTVNLPKGPLTRNTETGDLYEAPIKVTDYAGIVGALPEKIKKASEDVVTAKQKQLEDVDNPLFQAREEKLLAREGQLGKDTEISRLLSIMKGGLKAAAGKSQFALTNIAEGGEEGVNDFIKGEAARRAAKDKLDDYRDNLAMQKSAAKKGNIAVADAAGERAGDNLRQATTLQLTAANYGNSETMQQLQLQQAGILGKSQIEQQGILGLGNMQLQAKQLAQTGEFQNKQLALTEQRYAAMDKASRARLDQVRVNAFNGFTKDVAPQINAQLVKQYGPNWQTAKDPRSLEAQMIFKQYRDAHIIDALGKHDDRMSYGRSADELLQSGQ